MGLLVIVCTTLFAWGCGRKEEETPTQIQPTHELKVIARAYNSIKGQTDDDPFLTAWGDRLKPGMKAIAVSRDLIKMGLTRGTQVTIQGLEGQYTVLDKMHRRWRKKIDIYMGNDAAAARQWGRRKVVIRW